MKTSRLRSNFARKHLARTKKRRIRRRRTHRRRPMRGGDPINFKKEKIYDVYDQEINGYSSSGIINATD